MQLYLYGQHMSCGPNLGQFVCATNEQSSPTSIAGRRWLVGLRSPPAAPTQNPKVISKLPRLSNRSVIEIYFFPDWNNIMFHSQLWRVSPLLLLFLSNRDNPIWRHLVTKIRSINKMKIFWKKIKKETSKKRAANRKCE